MRTDGFSLLLNMELPLGVEVSRIRKADTERSERG